MTAWTKTPQDEHRLLSAVLATLLPHELLAAGELPEPLGRLGLALPVAVAVGGSSPSEARPLAGIWSALGGELKPSLDVAVAVPFPAYPDYDAGPPVTEGAAVAGGHRRDRAVRPVRWGPVLNRPGGGRCPRHLPAGRGPLPGERPAGQAPRGPGWC